jgi:hypothetical protein
MRLNLGIFSLFIFIILGVLFGFYDNTLSSVGVTYGILNPDVLKAYGVGTNSSSPDNSFVSVNTDRSRYMMGEFVRVTGNVFDDTGKPVSRNVVVEVSFVANTSRGIQSMPSTFRIESGPPLNNPVYQTVVSTTNGSYTSNVLNAINSGRYLVNVTLANSNQSSHTYFEVENPFTTLTARMMYLTMLFVIILLLVLAYGAVSQNLMEITTFVLLSAIVITPMFGLVLADVALGPNSPVGLVIKNPVDEEGQLILDETGQPIEGGQWIINVGGNQRNNYADGLSIPVYVIVFGAAGGYLRYLYETATTHTKETREEFSRIRNRITPQFYEDIWEFKQLPLSQRIASRFRKNRTTTQKLTTTSSASVTEQEEEKRRKEKIHKLTEHEVLKEKRKYYLFSSLRNLSLLFLSPLLAIAAWFLLLQAGIRDEQSITGQAGIFLIGAVSFTVGLVTDEVVQLLITSTNRILGLKGKRDDMAKSKLDVHSEFAKGRISRGAKQFVKVVVTEMETKEEISGATIEGIIRHEQDSDVKQKLVGLTDKSGSYSLEFKIDDYQPGRYILELEVSAPGHVNNNHKNSFYVEDGLNDLPR